MDHHAHAATNPFTNDTGTLPSGGRRLLRRGRVVVRLLGIFGWTAVASVVQSVLLVLPGRPKASFARFYWSMVCMLLGMRVRVIGSEIAGRMHAGATAGRRPVVYVSNHCSWLDVPVLGGRLVACFVSKDDVRGWPVISTVARLGRTIFVSRQRVATGRERDDMRSRLAAGDDLVLFPEGTSSDGSRVLPFHSAFFAVASVGRTGNLPPETVPLIQPVSVVYDRLAGLPVGRQGRAVFSWFGDMDLASHVWALAQWRDMRATILMHPPLDPLAFDSRKALSKAAWDAVASGAAALRQNRGDAVAPAAPEPLAPAAPEAPVPVEGGGAVSRGAATPCPGVALAKDAAYV